MLFTSTADDVQCVPLVVCVCVCSELYYCCPHVHTGIYRRVHRGERYSRCSYTCTYKKFGRSLCDPAKVSGSFRVFRIFNRSLSVSTPIPRHLNSLRLTYITAASALVLLLLLLLLMLEMHMQRMKCTRREEGICKKRLALGFQNKGSHDPHTLEK